MKAKILCQKRVVLPDAEIYPYDEDTDLVLSDVDIPPLSEWGHTRTGRFNFPLQRSLELDLPYFIELENGERVEITFTRVQATERYIRVGFKIKDADEDNRR